MESCLGVPLRLFYGIVLELLYNMLKLCCFLVWCWLHFVRVLWPCCFDKFLVIPGVAKHEVLEKWPEIKCSPLHFFATSWCNMMCIKKNCSKSWCVWLLWPVVWWAASSLDGWYIREISAPELTRVAPDDKSSIRWQQQHQMTRVAPDDKE